MAASNMQKEKVVFISAISSDIGLALAKRYASDGSIVAGTYRSKEFLPQLKEIAGIQLFYCDLDDKASITESIQQFSKLNLAWGTFISCAAEPAPLTGFFASDFEKWSWSVHINAIEQLRVLHELYPLRNKKTVSNVVFFAGPGTNQAVKDFSALTVSKIMLIKMCELLDAENADLNCFIVGPGWTRTKTHRKILSDPDVSREKKEETIYFLEHEPGTSMDDIYDCIAWLSSQGREVAGGRNFSVVHDCWGAEELGQILKKDIHMYKLRRFKNEWKERKA